MKKFVIIIFMVAFASVQAQMALAEPKVISLKWSCHSPPKAEGNLFFKNEWIPRIQKQIGDKYKLDFTFYHAQSLYKYGDQVQALEDGLIDLTLYSLSYELARSPLHEVAAMPFMGTGMDAQAASRIWFELQETIPAFGAEFSKYKEIFHFPALPRIFNTNKPARTPADFKGMKMQGAGMVGDIFKSIGAVPIRQPPSDWYTSLDRGLLDGIALGIVGVTMFKLQEVVKVHINFPGENFGWVGTAVMMNRKKFESLPPEIQKAIDANVKWASEMMTQRELEKNPKSVKICKDLGHTFIDLTPAEMDQWRAAVKPIQEQWIKKMEAKGLPGRKVYDRAMELAKKYVK